MNDFADSPSSDKGVAITELAICLPLLAALLVGMWDLSFILRENVVLSEAIRTGLRTIVVSQAFDPNRHFGATLADKQEEYAIARYENAITAARYVISRNGLDADHYIYNVLDVERTDPATSKVYTSVQMNISLDPTADRLILAPDMLYLTCLGGNSVIPGVFIGPGFNVSLPGYNSSCDP
jgi:Flp pilus assembly protein TadG